MPLEMTIPKSRGKTLTLLICTAICVVFAYLAVTNLFMNIAPIASGIWLAIVAFIVWFGSKTTGGIRTWLINLLGDLAGRQFVSRSPDGAQPREIYFGFRFLGHRFIQRTLSIDKIESVEWDTGQATDMAGRDMNDWLVFLWYDHNDPAESRKRAKWRKPDQAAVSVGPGRHKATTEAFRLAFIAFLREAGARLVRDKEPNHFVRDLSGSSEKTSIAPT